MDIAAMEVNERIALKQKIQLASSQHKNLSQGFEALLSSLMKARGLL